MMDRQGYSTAQIAVKLGVPGDTVKRYIRQQNAKRGKSDNPDTATADEKLGVYSA